MITYDLCRWQKSGGMEISMKIGFAQRCITPALPIRLSGYAGKRIAENVLDDLFVKAMVYQRGNETYGVLSYDLIGIDDVVIRQLKEGMKKLDLKQENFLFAATHTHSGPGGVLETREGLLKPAADIFVETDPALAAYIAQKSLEALEEAVGTCKETAVSIALSTLDHVGDNRNSRDLKGNRDIAAAFFRQEDGRKAVILNYACHPTVMNYKNQKVSADFPGAVAACMEQHGYDVCMYLNGSCGDISTRFSRRSSDSGELLRYGHMFEEKLLGMERDARPVEIHDFAVSYETIRMDLKRPGDIEEAERELEACEKRLQEAKQGGIGGSDLRVLESRKEGAQCNLALAQNPYTMTSCDVSVMFLNINRHIFVCVPGELFSELSNPLQTERVHFIGYANGYLGYFADESAYDHFYYEALSSPFEKGQGERLMRLAAEAVGK